MPRRQRGFSLVELIIAISIAAILMVLAVGSFRWLVNTNRLTSPANEMVASLQVARMESIRRNVRTVVCRSNNPDAGAAAACSTATGTWPGWIAFVDNGDNGTGAIVAANARNGVRDAGETLLRATTVNAPLEVRVSANLTTENNSIAFRSDGLARARTSGNPLSGIVSVCLPTAQPALNIREVALVAGGRISVSRFGDNSQCRTPPNTR